MRPPPGSPGCSPPEMWRTTSTVRQLPPRVRAAWRHSMRIAISRCWRADRTVSVTETDVDRPEYHHSIQALRAAEWNALGAADNPFTRYEFLAALERSRCVGAGTGWEPRYLTLRDARGLAAAAAAFVKTHSFGEFVFDFAWARGYERLGRRYYPKLTLVSPFTPATGPRLLVRADLDREPLAGRLLAELERYAVR